MDLIRIVKETFCVIGKEGTTSDGTDFIQRLWDDANSHFPEISELAKKDNTNQLVGVWGAMSDVTHSFKPWENNFSKGLYLAGVECLDEAIPPKGWTKWVIPGYEYLCVKCNDASFPEVISYMNEKNIPLVGAVHDFTCPSTGEQFMYFPIRKL
jgi:hypothetical protein